MTPSGGGRGVQLGIVPYLVAGCMFMENLDATAIVTALPAMARAFGVEITTLGLGVSSYLLAAAVALPLAPWLANRIGARHVMAAAICGFTLASILCGLSWSLPSFVAARIAQGAAAALMSPVGRLVVMRDTPKAAIVQVVAVLTWPALIAPLLGPPLGGYLTEVASWRWIFFLNVPIGLAGLLLVRRFLPQERREERTRFDRRGFLLYGGALTIGLVGLELTGSHRLVAGLSALAVGSAIGVLAVRHLRRTAFPLINLAPLAVASFAVSSVSAGTLSRIAISATPFLLPLMFQIQRDLSPAAAGAMMLIYFAGNLVMKLFTTNLLRRFGFRTILVLNGAIVGLTVGGCAAAPALPLAAVLALLAAAGAARSLQMTALNTLTFADIPPPLTGDAGTLNTLAQQIGMALGVACAATILGLVSSVRGEGATDAMDFAVAFACLASMGLGAVPIYRRLPDTIGEALRSTTAR